MGLFSVVFLNENPIYRFNSQKRGQPLGDSAGPVSFGGNPKHSQVAKPACSPDVRLPKPTEGMTF